MDPVLLYALVLLPFVAVVGVVALLVHLVSRSLQRIEALIAEAFTAPDTVAGLGQGGPVRTAEALDDRWCA